MTINIGDTVRFLREVGGGKVTGFRKGGFVLVEDKDGFEIPMLESDLVVIPDANPKREHSCYNGPTTEDMQEKKFSAPENNAQRLDPQHSISVEEKRNLEKRIEHLEHTVQKLARQIEEMQAANALRIHARSAEVPTQGNKAKKKPSKDEIIEIDLHAHALLDSTQGLSAGEIKDYQMNIFRQTMETYRRDRGRRIVFIHGNGDGVLRKAILTELKYTYKTCRHQDASFQQYGFGATMVTIG